MEKKSLEYIKSEKRENDSGTDLYHLFLQEDGRQLAVKHNKVCNYFINREDSGNFKQGVIYMVFLKYGGCLAISHNDKYIFNWGGRVIYFEDGKFQELNPNETRKSLTSDKAQLYAIRFFGSNGVTI